MSQPVLTATLALAISIVLTAAIAAAALAATRSRATKLTVLGAVIAVMAVALERTDVRINLTASMPIGIYLLSPLPPDEVKRGMMVAACAPAHAAEIGRRRGYLAAGPCADDAEMLLKFVVAVAGDEVDVTAVGITVDGCLLSRSRPEARDRSGRPLLPWPLGHYRLASGELWLYAPNARSWDSRYWGPGSVANVEAAATLCIYSRVPHASRLPIFEDCVSGHCHTGGAFYPRLNAKPGICVQ